MRPFHINMLKGDKNGRIVREYVVSTWTVLATVPTFDSCTKCVGSPGIKHTTACPIAIQFLGHGCMDDLTTERKVDLQAQWVIYLLGLFFDLLSMGVWTTRHCMQTSGRSVQKWNVCTVCIPSLRYRISKNVKIGLVSTLFWHGLCQIFQLLTHACLEISLKSVISIYDLFS